MMTFYSKKFLVVNALALSIAIALSVSCRRERKDDRSGATKEKDSEVTNISFPLGLRNFDQINGAMQVVTGVDANQKTVDTVYREVASQLPAGNDPALFTSTTQVAISKLATAYCESLFDAKAPAPSFLAGFAFNKAPTLSLQPDGRVLLIQGLTGRFWGQLESIPNKADSDRILNQLIDELLKGEDQTAIATTTKTVVGLCIAVLGSSPTVFF